MCVGVLLFLLLLILSGCAKNMRTFTYFVPIYEYYSSSRLLVLAELCRMPSSLAVQQYTKYVYTYGMYLQPDT